MIPQLVVQTLQHDVDGPCDTTKEQIKSEEPLRER